MEGKEAIIDSIIKSAETTAARIVEDAERDRDDNLSALKQELDKKYESAIEAAKSEAEQILSRRISVADMEKSKILLKKKQELIDRVYADAVTKALNMTDNLYRDFVTACIKKYADKHDMVIIAERDVKKLTKEWLESISKETGLNLSFSDEFHGFKGGVILSGKKCDKNLTLESIAKNLKEETRTEISDKLFKKGQ